MARKQSMRLRMFVLSALAPVLAIALERTADAASPLDTMFGGKAIVSRNFDVKASAIVNWRQMEDRFRQQQAGCQPADGCARFKELVASLAGLSDHDQLVAIRQAEKEIIYKDDIKTSGKADFWATPYETLSTRTGDTEDYAILAYYAMRAAGMPATALRVMTVRLRSHEGVGYAELLVDTAPEPLFLDDRATVPFPAAMERKDMVPTLGINEDTWWAYLP
jgi:predicted transglutaminase-like cysteine proteinase